MTVTGANSANSKVVDDVAGAAGPSASAPRQRLVLAIACGAAFISILDAAVVNLAYSAISADLASVSQSLTWIVTGYAVTFAAFLATAGRLADAVGHKVVVLIGVVGFGIASGVCALSPNAGVLIGARAAQGLAAALLLPSALGALMASTAPHRRAAAIGAWSAVGALAAAMGPAIGALLVDAWGWRAIFWANLPICALLAAAVIAAPGAKQRRRGLPDVCGAFVLAAGVGAIVAAASEGRQWNSVLAWATFAVGVVAVAGVVARSWHHPRPALEVRLWAQRDFAAASLVSFLLGVGMFAYLLHVPLMLIGPWKLSLLSASGCVGAAGVAAMIAAAAAGRVTTSANAHWCGAAGMVLLAMGFALLSSQAIGSSRSWLLWTVLVMLLGAGMGLAITAVSVVTAAAAVGERFATAFGMATTTRQVGGAIGIAVFAGIGAGRDFFAGFHLIFAIATVAALVGALTSAMFMDRKAPTTSTPPTTGSA